MFVHNSRPLIINSFNEYQTSLLKFCETTVNISSKTIYTTVLHIQRIVWFFWSAELWVDPHKIIDKKGHMRSSFAVNLYKCTCIVLTDYGMHGYLWQESYFLLSKIWSMKDFLIFQIWIEILKLIYQRCQFTYFSYIWSCIIWNSNSNLMNQFKVDLHWWITPMK